MHGRHAKYSFLLSYSGSISGYKMSPLGTLFPQFYLPSTLTSVTSIVHYATHSLRLHCSSLQLSSGCPPSAPRWRTLPRWRRCLSVLYLFSSFDLTSFADVEDVLNNLDVSVLSTKRQDLVDVLAGMTSIWVYGLPLKLFLVVEDVLNNADIKVLSSRALVNVDACKYHSHKTLVIFNTNPQLLKTSSKMLMSRYSAPKFLRLRVHHITCSESRGSCRYKSTSSRHF